MNIAVGFGNEFLEVHTAPSLHRFRNNGRGEVFVLVDDRVRLIDPNTLGNVYYDVHLPRIACRANQAVRDIYFTLDPGGQLAFNANIELLNARIDIHNRNVNESNCVAFIRIMLLILTLGIFDYRNHLLASRVRLPQTPYPPRTLPRGPGAPPVERGGPAHRPVFPGGVQVDHRQPPDAEYFIGGRAVRVTDGSASRRAPPPVLTGHPIRDDRPYAPVPATAPRLVPAPNTSPGSGGAHAGFAGGADRRPKAGGGSASSLSISAPPSLPRSRNSAPVVRGGGHGGFAGGSDGRPKAGGVSSPVHHRPQAHHSIHGAQQHHQMHSHGGFPGFGGGAPTVTGAPPSGRPQARGGFPGGGGGPRVRGPGDPSIGGAW